MDEPWKVLKFAGFGWGGGPVREYKSGDAPYRDGTRQTLLGDAPGEEWFNFITRYFEIQPGGYSTLARHQHPHAVVVIRGTGRGILGDSNHSLAALDCGNRSPGGSQRVPATGV